MGRHTERANDRGCKEELGKERGQGKTKWRRGVVMDKWMWTGMVVGWEVGEYPAGEGDGCGSGRPAG